MHTSLERHRRVTPSTDIAGGTWSVWPPTIRDDTQVISVVTQSDVEPVVGLNYMNLGWSAHPKNELVFVIPSEAYMELAGVRAFSQFANSVVTANGLICSINDFSAQSVGAAQTLS